jgi:alpha-glucosidase
MPYLYSVFWEHHRYGFPILRPLVMLEQEDISNSFRQDEFTFGDKILVCPVLEQGATSRMVYLPKGKWVNFWTHEVLTGESEYNIAAALDHMPLFIRAGSVIPEYPVMQYVGEKDVDEVMLNVYFCDYEVNSFLYEDHGDTFAYEQDIYSEKKFTVKGSATNLVIEQSRTGLYTPTYELYNHNIIGLPFKVNKITIDDKELIDFTLDERNCLRFKSNKNFTIIKIYN